MFNQIKQRLQGRQHAGQLLADKLKNVEFDRSDSLVLAIPQGGIPVGREVALQLNLPFDIIFSKRLKHPAHSEQSIGAVSLDDVVLEESAQFIPQSYVLNEIASVKRALNEQFKRYYGSHGRNQLLNKTILLVDDVLREINELTACLQILRRENVAKVIVAAPVANLRVIHYLEEENIDHHYLFIEISQQSKPGTYFPTVTEEETNELFRSLFTFSGDDVPT